MRGGRRELAIEELRAEDFFPYPSFRRYQEEVISFALEVFLRRRIGLINAPCGIGKSIAVLTAYLMARKAGLSGLEAKLMVLTRTKAQLEIYVREIRRIRDVLGMWLRAAVFASRQDMCPLKLDVESLAKVGYKDFLRACKQMRSRIGALCPYYEATYGEKLRLKSDARAAVRRALEMGATLPGELVPICKDLGVCAYEVVKNVARKADVLIGNYNYLLLTPVREAILWRFRADISGLNCVIDEAHNIDEWAVKVMSDEISSYSFRRAEKEAEEFGVQDRGLMTFMAEKVDEMGQETYKLHGLDHERLVDPDILSDMVMNKLGLMSHGALRRLLRYLEEEGDRIRLERAEKNQAPISFLGRCASFLKDFFSYRGQEFAHYSKAYELRGDVRGRLGVRCLDPSMTASVLNELRSAILMSGTLWNPSYYVEVLGLDEDRVDFLSVPSPFPKENKLILVDKAVTTKYELRNEEEFDNIAKRLEALIRAIKGRVAIYFPSYDIMSAIAKRLNLDLPALVERRDTRVGDVLSFMRGHEACLLLGVARGKVSEGIDMSAGGRGLLSGVIIVGLPYPKKTGLQEALTAYFEKKFGRKGWHYANTIPCLNALAQAAGRLQRSEHDRGVVVIMDKRADGRFKRFLPRSWRADMMASDELNVLTAVIRDFMAER